MSVSTAFTPHPSVWVIETSKNEGKQYNMLAYLVSQPEQCTSMFGSNSTDKNLCIVQEPVKNGSSEKVRKSDNAFLWLFVLVKKLNMHVFQGCGIV